MLSQIFILAGLIILSGLFSGTETALMSVSRLKVKALFEQGRRGSGALKRIKEDPHRLIITILIGNNIVNIGAAAWATKLFTDAFGSMGVGIATGVMTFLILIFGEITPKTYAASNAEPIALFVAKPVEMLSWLLFPLVWMFGKISRAMNKLFGGKNTEKVSEEELRALVTMGREEGILSEEAAEMMENVLKFEGTKVTEVMTPEADIKMIDGDARLKDVIDYIVKQNFSRYPIYEGKHNNIIGILDVDDVLKFMKNNRLDAQIKEMKRPAYFVPESKEVDDLLDELEGNDLPMAIIVDEYSTIEGLVTVEDILEEIVGEIFDKSKKTSLFIKKLNDNTVRVDARAPVDEVNKALSIGIKEGRSFETIAGYVEWKLERIPEKGAKIKLKKAIIEVDEVTKQGIKSVKISKR